MIAGCASSSAARPAIGHFTPLVPLARAFADGGHEVAFATAADFAERVAAAGFAGLPAGVSLRELRPQMEAFWIRIQQVPPDERRPETFAYRFATLDAPAKLDALLMEATAWQPDLIVHETADLAAPPVAAALGVPSAQHSFGRLLPQACLERAAPVTARCGNAWGSTRTRSAGYTAARTSTFCPPSLQDASPPDGTRILQLRRRRRVQATLFGARGSPAIGRSST